MKVVFFLLNTEMLQKGYVREIQDQAKARHEKIRLPSKNQLTWGANEGFPFFSLYIK